MANGFIQKKILLNYSTLLLSQAKRPAKFCFITIMVDGVSFEKPA